MSFRIRRIETTATGREIVRDQDVAGDTLSLGRLAGNDLSLPDLAIDPRHAMLTQVGHGQVRAEAMGALAFTLDGREARSALIDVRGGAELGLGTYRIIVSADADGAVLLTVRRTEEAASPSGDLEAKRGFSLGTTLPGKRAVSWGLVVAILVAFLAVPIVSHLTRDPASRRGVIGDASWDPGALSLAHRGLSGRCEACHVKPFESVRDETCRTCHKDTHDHADPKRLAAAHGALPGGEALLWSIAHAFGKPGPGACQDCHVEHQGAGRMAPPVQRFCADCHARIRSGLPDTRLGNAGDFGTLHPAFSAWVVTDPVTGTRARRAIDAHLREDNGLTFAHRVHLDPRGGVARMARAIGSDALGHAYGAKGLQCRDCHRPTSDGESFAPVVMERDCEGCHSLAYDRVGGIVRRLRHGNIEQLSADLAAARWHGAGSRPSSLLLDQRRRPGQVPASVAGTSRARSPAWPALSLGQALSPKGVCGECHRPLTHAGQVDVVPVRQPTRYMAHGWFDHAAHRQEKCTTCHAAGTSTKASDVLLPGLATCRTCHGGEAAKARKIPSTCVMCHGYHTVARGTRPKGPSSAWQSGLLAREGRVAQREDEAAAGRGADIGPGWQEGKGRAFVRE